MINNIEITITHIPESVINKQIHLENLNDTEDPETKNEDLVQNPYLFLLKEFEESIGTVFRFRDPDLLEVNPDFKESALTHTYQLMNMAEDMCRECPELKKLIKGKNEMHTLFFMLFFHEAGEPLGGDMPKTMHNYSELKNERLVNFLKLMNNKDEPMSAVKQRELLKRREHKIVTRIISNFVPVEYQNEFIQLYMRFEEPQEGDLIAQIAVLLDVLDGARTFFKQFAPNLGKVLGQEAAESKIRASQGFISEQFSRVAALLPETVHSELKQFMNNMAEQAGITKYFPQV